HPPPTPLCPYTTLFRSPEQPQRPLPGGLIVHNGEYYFSEFPPGQAVAALDLSTGDELTDFLNNMRPADNAPTQVRPLNPAPPARSEEHTSELQSRENLV